MTAEAAILAADGGNSKVDLLLAGADGRVLGFRHGETISHQQVGMERGMERLVAGAVEMAGAAGDNGARPVAGLGVFCLAGADFPAEVRKLQRALDGTGIVGRTVVRNDTVAALRAGTDVRWGVALICGQGVNGVAIGPDGRTARFDAVGDISGDWGGATGLGQAALAAAVRAQDGRGPRTSMSRLVPAHFGRRSPAALVRDLYYGRVAEARLAELAPIVFEAATAGDAVARQIADRLADELVAMAAALIRRTRLQRLAPEVVLAGGVFRNRDEGFYRRLDEGIRLVAPGARLVPLKLPPVVGAALIGLDLLELSPDRAAAAEARLRAEGGALKGAPVGRPSR